MEDISQPSATPLAAAKFPEFFRKQEDAEEYILESQPAVKLGCKIAVVVGEFVLESTGGAVAQAVSQTYRSLSAPFVSAGPDHEA